MQQPLVSVLMSTYNGAAFIQEQLTSLLDQTYRPLELIVIDDASADNTVEIIEAIKKETETPIHIYRNPKNKGYNKNFTEGLQWCNGELIAYADQDDKWLPQKIEKLVQPFADEKVMVAHCKSVMWVDDTLKHNHTRLHHHFKGNDARQLFMFNQLNGHNMLFRRSLIGEIKTFPEGMMYDWWTAVLGAVHGTVASVPEVLVYHRRHAQNNYFKRSKATGPDLPQAIALLQQIKDLTPNQRNFLNGLVAALQQKKEGFDLKLFRFLYRHRRTIFGHKRRRFPELSFLKAAIRYAKTEYRGKGIAV